MKTCSHKVLHNEDQNMGDLSARNESQTLLEREGSHLEETLTLVRSAIDNAESLFESTEDSYEQIKTYMVENRGEIDPSESFQNELFLNMLDRNSAQAHRSRERLTKLLDTPYFAKVVFLADGSAGAVVGAGAGESAGVGTDASATETYIGRFAFSPQNRLLISDWRSPVAGLFYDYDVGRAKYEAPAGIVSGELKQKVQFKIENGEMIFALDNGTSIRDEVLQEELEKTSDQKMRTIISTIQREQNQIIRDEATDILVIQGVAGSGKTSIALHRIAYLLYRQKDTLSSKSVAILSPNRVFSDYISNVLPELGEEPIQELCAADIYNEVIDKKVVIEPARFAVDVDDEKWHQRARYKSSHDFLRELLAYLDDVVKTIFVGRDIKFGSCVIEGSWLDALFYKLPNLSVNERLDLLVSDVLTELNAHIFQIGVKGIPNRSIIRAKLNQMIKFKGALALYRQFFKDSGKGAFFRSPDKLTIEHEDAPALAIVGQVFDRQEEFRNIKHLVIDEMQDLSPAQHYLISTLFTCQKTILGDFYQMLDTHNPMQLDALHEFYAGAHILSLTKSYRSTQEIMDLAKKVKHIPELEPIARHGQEPEIIQCGNTVGALKVIAEAIAEFAAGPHRTLGILHRSEAVAKIYHRLLSQEHEVNLITQDSTSFNEGISISSIKMAKGLEFDEVIVLDADQSQYGNDDDRGLLYVAITRAMHKLTILYRVEIASFLR
jgi:DNA helicase-2/ATP-dependent DNA helicase PcrA